MLSWAHTINRFLKCKTDYLVVLWQVYISIIAIRYLEISLQIYLDTNKYKSEYSKLLIALFYSEIDEDLV